MCIAFTLYVVNKCIKIKMKFRYVSLDNSIFFFETFFFLSTNKEGEKSSRQVKNLMSLV